MWGKGGVGVVVKIYIFFVVMITHYKDTLILRDGEASIMYTIVQPLRTAT